MKTDEQTLIWKALADPTRRHILDLLRNGPHTTGELADVFPALSRYAVMKHLGVLKDAQLILIRREGRKRYNQLNVVPIQTIYERWMQPYEALWAQSLIDLKRQAEGVNMETHKIEQEIIVNAPPEKTFAAMLNVNGWWQQRYSKLPDSLYLKATVGGRFWESRDGGEGNGILWGTVTSIEPNDHIQINGPIGMQGAVIGSLTICTNPQEDGTTQVTLSHHILGEVPERLLAGFSAGWEANLKALRTSVEKKDD